MKTLFRTSMVVGVALAFICLTAPLGHTGEFLCANCGVDNEYPKCPPGVYKLSQWGCPDIKDVVGPKTSQVGSAVNISSTEDSDLAYGLSPAWSDGALDENTVCHKCGAHFTTDSRIRKLATQP